MTQAIFNYEVFIENTSIDYKVVHGCFGLWKWVFLWLHQTSVLTSLVVLLLPDVSDSGNDEANNNAESGHSSHLYNSKINCLKTSLTHR